MSENETMSVTSGFPFVKVPVLSKIIALIFSAASRGSPPLIKIPCSAPLPVPTIIAVGVAKSSAQGQLVDKVKKGVEEARVLAPDISVDGEFQVDSALDPEVAKIKTSAKDNKVAGKANVLIFPNLDSGNISYKLVQRLANARAIGPIIQGLNKPASDLSRGCIVDDVIDAVAITALRAQ